MVDIVTGASGHLGRQIVAALIARGDHPTRALVHRDSEGLEGLPIELAYGDVRDAASLDAAFEGARVVYHAAALITLGDQRALASEVNIEGTGEVLAAARRAGVTRVVHISSAFVFDPAPRERPVDESRAYVVPPRYAVYEVTKIAAEGLVREAVAEGLDAVIVNPTALVGPPDLAPSRAGRLLLDLYHRRIPALIRGGFDWVDVRDAAQGALAAAARGRPGERYILGGRWRSLRALAELVAEVTGRRPPRITLPRALARAVVPLASLWGGLAHSPPRVTRTALDALGSNHAISSDKAARELGFVARPLRETIEDFFAWASQMGLLDPSGSPPGSTPGRVEAR